MKKIFKLIKNLKNILTYKKSNLHNSRKIIHITPAYPPSLGGMEKVVQSLAILQFKSNLNVSIITSDKDIKNKIIKENFIITRLKTITFANTRIMPNLLSKLIQIKHNDIIHLHITSAYIPELVWLTSIIKKFKYVAHLHLDLEPKSPAGILLKIYKPFILKYVLRSASYVVVFTDEQKEKIHKQYDIDLSRIAVIPNGVGDEFYYSKKRKLHKIPRLLFVGRLEKQKNVQLLLHALQGVSEKFDTFIVGDGSLLNDLKKISKKLKLKNIHFEGRADGDKLRNYFRQSDIFILPSEREGMPLVLLEATAMGMPIVATDVTGNRDIVNNRKNGLLTPLGDVEKMREAIIKTTSDNKIYQKFSKASQQISKNFTWEKTAKKFEKLYNNLQPVASQKIEKTKEKTNGYKLWYLLLPLLAAANGAYFLNNFIGWAITLGFFIFIPGYLLLSLLKHEMKSRWEIASFSLGLSLLLMMLGGLALNTLNVWGLEKPLTTINIFTMLDILTLILLFFNRKKIIQLSKPKITYSIRHIVMTFFLTLLPFLAAGGAISLNNHGPNTFTMILFGLIPVLFMILIWRKEMKNLYPYAVFMMGTAVLFSTSLRGWFITGHDIHHEFSVFQTTNINNLWPVRTSSGDPYNACLSITILPTIIAKITNIYAPYVYKVVFQIIFGFGLIPIYFFINKLSNKYFGMIAVLLFISFPPFLNDMPFLNRQEMGFVFFGLLILVNFLEMKRLPKTLLIIGMMSGLIFAHYASTYVAISIMIIAWFSFTFLKRIQPIKERSILPLASLPIIIGALLFTYVWQSVITVSANNLVQTLTWTIKGIENKTYAQQANGVGYALFSAQTQTPQEILNHYAKNNASKVRYVPEKDLPLTPLGKSISSIINVKALNIFMRAFSARMLQILLILGLIVMYFKNRKKSIEQNIYFYTLTLACFILLVLITLLPQLSMDYSVTRLFQQTLIIISLPIIIAAEFLLRFLGRYKTYLVVAFFAFLFLHLSGFIPELLGGYPPQLSLNNAGMYYDIYYEHESELKSAEWFYQQPRGGVIADLYANSRYTDFQNLLIKRYEPFQNKKAGVYIYQDYLNTKHGLYANFLNGDVIEYSVRGITNDASLLYNNSGSRIYITN